MTGGGPQTILGVDPGLSGAGALVFLPEPGARPRLLAVWDMPTRQETLASRRTSRPVVDAPRLAVLMRGAPGCLTPDAVVVEKVHAAPGQGVTSMFRFGYGAGVIEGTAAALGLPYGTVPPKEWKRAVGLPVGADKAASCPLAAQVFPERAEMFARKKDNGRADAALIALSAFGGRIFAKVVKNAA